MAHDGWYKVAELDELADGRVQTVVAGSRSICLTHWKGSYGALDNRCPHQAGPLGEGSIEGGWLRCPWHGWDFDPLTGVSPGGYDERVPTYPIEIRDDGIYVRTEPEDESSEHQPTVSDLMVETMIAWGTTSVFGMVGHSNLGLADAIRRQHEAGRLHYYGIRHEGAGAFAASAYGKLTGRAAACLTIAGPGATNLLTGMWDAKVDRAPVLALTGQVDAQVLGPGAFQEVDLASAFSSVASFSQTVYRDSRHVELMNLACKNASVRRDVAHLVFPDEIQTLPVAGGVEAGGPMGRVTPIEIAPPEPSLEDAVQKLRAAKRPVFIVGHGARFHMDEVVVLAEELGAPVVTTFKGKGLISDHHELGCGVLGRSGTPIASWFMNESDLLMVFGASFSNHTGITTFKPIIQVDFDPMALGKFHPVDVPVWGEIGLVAKRLRERLGSDFAATDQRGEVAERWRIWRREKERRVADERGEGVGSAAVFEAMHRLVPADAIIAVDVGNNTYSFGRYFECREQAVLMSGYLGSIGFGYPAAMGAWAATQDDPRFAGRKVLAVTGDGGFGQYLAEVTTAVRHGMDITHVLINNSELGKISKEQRAIDLDVWMTSLSNPNFADFVTSCGGFGIRVERVEQLVPALQEALAYEGPSTVEILADALLV